VHQLNVLDIRCVLVSHLKALEAVTDILHRFHAPHSYIPCNGWPISRPKATKPAAGCTLDADLNAEFVEPIDKAPEISVSEIQLQDSVSGSVA